MSETSWTFTKTAVVAGLLSSVLLATAGLLAGQYSARPTRLGWAPHEYLAFTRDLPAGHVLSRDDVERATGPEQFFTDTALPAADDTTVAGRRLEVPVARGQVVSRTLFVPRPVSLVCGAAARLIAAEQGHEADRVVTSFLFALDGALATQPARAHP
jgi:hypothetical protein